MLFILLLNIEVKSQQLNGVQDIVLLKRAYQLRYTIPDSAILIIDFIAAKKIQNLSRTCKGHSNLGYLYMEISEYDKAIEEQKKKVEEAHFLLEEKNEEIITSIRYAKRIQDSLLTSQKYIERNINRLKSMGK
ncbi:MAG: hypothetical protein OQJ96_10655 [Flavobacteriales bacterium]|nr:hypothetical protein [Flavobacteriales bacterium]MCW8914155.1 hypothetical protein [Flavobacteriales bacterium]MCW8938296.1 hypothetical protein [Flavobacteriales bacterium]MCW8940369.1 hypothetical protein [Flavobacteriales bacterium]MCW8969417.1 hypothetical protein [Flavobacteriales bacterium]